MMRGQPMPKELVVAILEVGADVGDLESGVLEQLDESGARVKNEMSAEVLRHPLSLRRQVNQPLRVEGRQEKHAPGLEEILDPAEGVMRIGHVLEDVEECDRIEGRTCIHESRK